MEIHKSFISTGMSKVESVTNLKVAEEGNHISEVLESCFRNTSSQNGSGVDLAIFCVDKQGLFSIVKRGR